MNLKKWLPAILTVLTGSATMAAPEVQAYFAQHTTLMVVLVTVCGLVLNVLKSPLAPASAPAEAPKPEQPK